MKPFFLSHLALELQHNEEALKIYNILEKIFPNSNYILSQKAIANNNLRGLNNLM